MTTALITGASVGIGAAFARELARTGHDLVLVSRNADDLRALADTLDVTVEVLPADLSRAEDIERVAARLAVQHAGADAPAGPVDLLVNNAGFSTGAAFLDAEVATEVDAHTVMTTAVLVLSHAAGRAMQARGHGAIVNVASVASWLTSGTYSADKVWVRTFSEGLHADLAPHGVVVTALCPGLTRTQFHARAGLSGDGPRIAWLSADRVVRDCLDAVRRRRPVCVPGAIYTGVTTLLDVMPGPAVRFVTGVVGGKGRTH